MMKRLFVYMAAMEIAGVLCVFHTNGGRTLKMHYQAGTMMLLK